MPRRTAVLLAAAAAVVVAARGTQESWRVPEETDIAAVAEQQLRLGSSPRPTSPPQPQGHRFALMNLMPRMAGYTLSSNTCGYDADDGAIITCVSASSTCGFSGDYVGCCEPGKSCSRLQTSCIDYAASKTGACNLPFDFHTLCCSSDAPACFTYLATRSDSSTYKALVCSTQSGQRSLLDYDPRWSRTHSFPPSTVSHSLKATTAGAEQVETAGGGGGGRVSSFLNVPAIAGGAVGGLAVVGIIGLLALLLLRRRQGNGKASDASPQEAMAQSQPLSPHAFSPSASNYDAHMSVYSQHGQLPQAWNGQQYGPPPPGGYQPYGAAPGFGAPLATSPPPTTMPSPSTVKDGEVTPQGATPPPPAPHTHQPSELATGAPLRNENHRAELGG